MTAQAFRRWYESRNLTQTQVAGLLGIRQRRVSDMATGKSPVSRQTQRQLRFLDVAELALWDMANDVLRVYDREFGTVHHQIANYDWSKLVLKRFEALTDAIQGDDAP